MPFPFCRWLAEREDGYEAALETQEALEGHRKLIAESTMEEIREELMKDHERNFSFAKRRTDAADPSSAARRQ